jgi:gamma-glutamyltranspeptidase / glutathione hydrolase
LKQGKIIVIRIISLSLYAFAVLVIGFIAQPPIILAQGIDPGASSAVDPSNDPATNPALYGRHIVTPVISNQGMVSTQDIVATRVGAQILADGGNAVDAAVATAFALAVVHPSAGNLGGGGFMLVYLAAQDRTIAIDYREVAPMAASRDMFLDDNGNVDNERARDSHLSAGVPGTVAGMYHALSNYGTMAWPDVIAPAIRLAEEGMIMPYDFASSLRSARDKLTSHPATRAVFYKENGDPYGAGERFVQADLGATLRLIANQGPDAFYRGEIADLIVAEMERGGGLITHQDLANYRARERDAVRGTYRGFEIASMPPPSSGGIHIIQMLNILENFDLAALGAGSANAYHLIAEAMRYAFADRAEHLGDPDYYDVPVEWITSKEYGRELAAQINMDHARPSSEVSAGTPQPYDSPNTTHFSIADKAGNVVSNTYTLNLLFGSGQMVTGAGFLLNDEMDDFSSKPGVPNAFLLIGNEANAIEPGKVPLSSMSPTIVFKDGKPWMATGGAGGSQIISVTLQNIINMIDFDMNLAEAVLAPRIHHQWLPDMLYIQPGISPDTQAILAARGHALGVQRYFGRTASIAIENGVYFGFVDPRALGGGALGPDYLRQ